MKNIEIDSNSTTSLELNSRREFLTRFAVVGLAAATLVHPSISDAAGVPDQPAADTGHHYPFASIYPTTGAEFGKGIIGVVTVSNIISGLGIDRAVNADAKDFANFELRETISVLGILKGAGTPTPRRSATLRSVLASVSAAQGSDFDKAYIAAQLGAHEWLRDTAEYFLSNPADPTSDAEKHALDVASLSLAFFKEHIVLAKKIKTELTS